MTTFWWFMFGVLHGVWVTLMLTAPAAMNEGTPATKGESTATGDLDDCWDKAYDAKLERGYQARRAAKRGKPAGIADTETPRADG